MRNYTREDIFEMIEEEDIGFIRLQFTDMLRDHEKCRELHLDSCLESAMDDRLHDRPGCDRAGFAKDRGDGRCTCTPDISYL